MMEYDVRELDPDDLYFLLIDWVAPRPIAWVSTLSKEGVINLAPFSFFNVVCDQPPVLMLSISKKEDGTRKDTARNILDSGEFVVNFLEMRLLKKVRQTAEDFPSHVSELEVVKLTPEPSAIVKPPRVKECPASFECRLLEHKELYNYDLILGEVVFIVIRKRRDYRVGRVGERFCKCPI
jgi:flavin reductase (DIM6/NTAB) family NADH-FMN oxidoreductase RutF